MTDRTYYCGPDAIEPPEPDAPDTGRSAAEWHRYLHQEGMLVEDSPGEECGPWHHRVFLGEDR